MFYILLLWTFLLTTAVFVPTFFISELSFSTGFLFLKYYTPYYLIITLLFFLLSGLPPTGLFLVKINLLTYMVHMWDFATIVLVFLILFFNMLFYLQVLRYKSGWIFLRSVFHGKHYTANTFNSNLSYRHLTLPLPLLAKGNSWSYEILYLIIFTSTLLVFFFFFIPDLFLIVTNLTLV